MLRTQILPALLCLVLTSATGPAVPQAGRSTTNDLVIAHIKEEGLNHSQVMQTLSYLSDVIGPRLTGSPNLRRANEWTRDRLRDWGLQSAHLEAWGPFGRGWSLERFSAQVVEPQDIPLIAFPKAWSPGWKGTKVGEVVYVDAKDEAGLQKYHGRLRGAFVLIWPPHALHPHFEPQASRLSDAQLRSMEEAAPPPQDDSQEQTPPPPEGPRPLPAAVRFELKLREFLFDEGVACVVEPSPAGDGGNLYVEAAFVSHPVLASTPGRFGTAPWDRKAIGMVPQIVVAAEHYNRLVRMLEAGEKLKMAAELSVRFYDSDPMAYNTIAEIPGTDRKDELVMLGGHLDSWHSGTGATDNGAGVAVCMEAVRILEALHLQPRRTIRIGLWSGEEQGTMGSGSYVAQHFGRIVAGAESARAPGGSTAPIARRRLEEGPEYNRLSAYFNLDTGTGRIRGIYAQSNKAARPIFQEWLAPFAAMGAKTVTLLDCPDSTDHLAFDAIGLPGFEFIQDDIDYGTRTHHTSQDLFDRAQEDDLKQAAVIMAAFIYDAAMRDDRLPRNAPSTP